MGARDCDGGPLARDSLHRPTCFPHEAMGVLHISVSHVYGHSYGAGHHPRYLHHPHRDRHREITPFLKVPLHKWQSQTPGHPGLFHPSLCAGLSLGGQHVLVPIVPRHFLIRLMQPRCLLDKETEAHSGEMTPQRHTGLRIWYLRFETVLLAAR